MTLERKIESTKSIAVERVGTALQHHSMWSIELHHFCNDWLEKRQVAMIIDSIMQWNIQRVVLLIQPEAINQLE
jgi:hypothetical protein